jgi:membrane protein DedA with SNARE-associated domain
LAALLGGANHMRWRRFMTSNAAASIVWSALYGFGAYMLGQQATHLAGPAALGMTVVAVLLAAGLHVHRGERRRPLAQPVDLTRTIK